MTTMNGTSNGTTESAATSKSTSSSQVLHQQDGLTYLSGFGNHHETEAEPSILPRGRNNPRQVPGNLYTEQLSGTAFTAPRSSNRKTWLYRIRPSVAGTSSAFRSYVPRYFGGCDLSELRLDPNPMRWGAMPLPGDSIGFNFLDSMKTFMGSGDPTEKSGLAIHFYACNCDMYDVNCPDENRVCMYNSDGDFLIVPQLGSLLIYTEMGKLIVHPTEICVIPRGVVFSVNRHDSDGARGYILEIFKGHFTLPELGPIGSNGLANTRDFLYPTAWHEDRECFRHGVLINKFGNELFVRQFSSSPYNVVAWHGTYAPYKYDLKKFCAMNSVTYDHPDPSIYTVLTAQSDEPGTALADFVIFPPRIMATDDNTFRPPWFHRNIMAEFMGLIYGQYDAKREGFVPGGASLHNTMTPHGPDADTYRRAVEADCSKPTKFESGLAFMFETSLTLKCSEYALNCPQRQLAYAKCWDGLDDNFTKYKEDRKRISGDGDGGETKKARLDV